MVGALLDWVASSTSIWKGMSSEDLFRSLMGTETIRARSRKKG